MRGTRTLYEHRGLAVRLTPERLGHILDHPKIKEMEAAIEQTLERPEYVIRSLIDNQARLYYRAYADTPVGDKFLCVVVKVLERDAFVLTAYLTDRLKRGEVLMERGAVKLWYDSEGDYMEVLFEKKTGYFRATEDDRIMEKVDPEGNVLGFSVLGVSSLKGDPVEVALS